MYPRDLQRRIGRLDQLTGRGERVRAAAIDEEDASRLPEGVEHAIFDFEDPRTFDAALEGVDRVFLDEATAYV